MITLVIPSRNRAHTIRLVGESFYRQNSVNEIIFVDDAGSDDSPRVIAGLAARFPEIRTLVLRNDERKGAAFSRTRGFTAATNQYVMFCDDDVHLERDYAATCLEKLLQSDAAIVSGRLVHKRPDETPEQAIARFGVGTSNRPVFKKVMCEFRVEARFEGDIDLPLTHSVILTRKSLLEKYGYDPFYSRGNGYREESDFQLNVFVNGGRVVMTNDVHCVELSRRENPSGGQRTGRLQRLYYAVHYTNYFFGKYYDRYAARTGVGIGRRTAIVAFAAYQLYVLFVKPAGILLRRAADAVRRAVATGGFRPQNARREYP